MCTASDLPVPISSRPTPCVVDTTASAFPSPAASPPALASSLAGAPQASESPALVLVVRSRGESSSRRRPTHPGLKNHRLLLDYVRAEPSSPPEIEQALMRRTIQRRAALSRTARLYQWGVPPVSENRVFFPVPE